MKRIHYVVGLVLGVSGVAALGAADGVTRTLIITYTDGHVQTVGLERDAALIESLRFDGERIPDLSGQWSMRMEDPYAYYVSDAVLERIGSDRWQVNSTLRETNHSFHRTRIGETDSDCIVTLEGKKVIMICDGYDPNPSARGRYHQEFEGEFDSQGVLHGVGRHEGVLSHSTRWEMRRR